VVVVVEGGLEYMHIYTTCLTLTVVQVSVTDFLGFRQSKLIFQCIICYSYHINIRPKIYTNNGSFVVG
jgi:hypothetical protein